MDRYLDYAGLQNKDFVPDEKVLDTMFQNVQLFGDIFSDEITKNSMIFLCTRKGAKTFFIRLHVIEGREREFELGMILLFAARLGCIYGHSLSDNSMSEEELEEHASDLEKFVYETTHSKKTKSELIDKIRVICNSNIEAVLASVEASSS